jgi:hypothetical protein
MADVAYFDRCSSIEAAIGRAFAAAGNDARIPRDHDARLALLRSGLIPWLAGIDPDASSPRRLKLQTQRASILASLKGIFDRLPMVRRTRVN